ncbi:MAG: hypothetical protein IT426_09495 [Pirellulales bacterium]|nr:hypothetical protein [Pirellulales bacterium]
MRYRTIVAAGLLVCMGTVAAPGRARGQNDDPNMPQRLNRLEAETQALRAELERLRQSQPKRLPEVVDRRGAAAIPASASAAVPAAAPRDYYDAPPLMHSAASASYAPGDQPAEDTFTLEELKGEMKKLVWKKGDFTITPYGFLWGNIVYETERSNTGDYTLWVFSAQREGEPTFHVDGKNTRLGIDVLGPKLACLNDASTGGKVEVDFQGFFITENKGALLLRHAYLEAKDERFRLLAGQTWDVISPLLPGSIMYSVYWDAGNIGYRRPQFRGERFLAFSDALLLTLQGSINGNVVADTSPLGVGDQSGWPILEGRAALTFGPRGKNDLPITVGVSSHVGEQRFLFPIVGYLPAKTWSLNADWKVPFNECTGIQGECFMGDNLSAFFGGIGQGYDFTLRESIYSRGGWMEFYHYWSPRWHSHFGYCLDDPDDNDIAAAAGRIYNQVYFGNIIFDITKQFQLGLEVGSWKTLYKGETPGEDLRTEFMVKYGF